MLLDATVLGEMNPPLEMSQEVNHTVCTHLFRIIHCADESNLVSLPKYHEVDNM